MKTFKFLMPFLLVAFVLAGCDTDDLKNDIDELKNRVESLEAQVSAMNDNVNALKVFVDGNKTIKSYEPTTDGYKLVLSDGQELTLTQGKKGEVSTPEISISDDGDWVIDGVEQEGKKAVGNDAPVPTFSIKEETIDGEKGSYWYVDMKDGNGEVPVLGPDEKPVKATTSGNIEGGDKFFESVRVDDYKMVVKLKDDSKEYSLPIVEGLTCKIVTDGVDGFKDGVLTIGYGQSKELEVEISEATYMVTAPAGWTAVLGDIAEGKATLTVTAPASASAASRATADNTKDLVLQVNKGVSWAIDKIQVKAETVINSYYDLYQAGETLELGGVSINKSTYGEAVLVNTADYAFKADNKVFFIEPDVEIEWNIAVNFETLILIGNNSSKMSKMAPKKQIKLSDANNAGKGLFLAHNLEINTNNVYTDKPAYLLAQNGDSKYGKVLFDNCKIISLSGQPLTYISTSTRSFADFTVQNSKIENTASDKQQYFISLGESTATYDNINFVNNVFYCKDSGNFLSDFKLFNGKEATITNLKLHNNTFVNLASGTTFFVYVANLSKLDIANNLSYFDRERKSASGFIRTVTTKPTGTYCDKNIVYKTDNQNWQIFYGGIKNGFDGAVENEIIKTNPFEGGKFDLTTGTFVPNSNYADYGAKLD